MYYVFNAEAVFHKRANVPTLSPAFWHYILAYGFVFLLAVLAGVLVVRGIVPPAPILESHAEKINMPAGNASNPDPQNWGGGAIPLPLLFAVCWAVGGFLVCYLPFAFQRKMLMGEHIPLCLLAGVGAARLVSHLKPKARTVALAALVLASLPSNVFFLLRDFRHLQHNRSETHLSPFLSTSLVDVYRWFHVNTPADAAVVGFPGLCTALPGEAGRAVWAGHWAETPSYGKKDAEFADAFDRLTPDTDRRAFLQSTHTQYLFYPNDISQATFKRHGGIHSFVELTAAPPPYLTEVYKNDTFTVYRIR
jgi:hypothetical protein